MCTNIQRREPLNDTFMDSHRFALRRSYFPANHRSRKGHDTTRETTVTYPKVCFSPYCNKEINELIDGNYTQFSKMIKNNFPGKSFS